MDLRSILTPEENLLRQAILEAGEELLKYWPGNSSAEKSLSSSGKPMLSDAVLSDTMLSIQKKKDGSLVTSADFASNEIITSALRELFPEDGILSEEVPVNSALKLKERIWIIDPLDGTKSFTQGNDDYSILVALATDKQINLGFMYFPSRRHFLLAKKGSGSWSVSQSGELVQLRVSNHSSPRPEKVYIRNFSPDNTALVYKPWLDSGCAFSNLAEGIFDGLIIKLLSHREWDLAAPSIIVQESGGVVSDERGEPIKFEPNGLESGLSTYKYFVASNGASHPEILDLIDFKNY